MNLSTARLAGAKSTTVSDRGTDILGEEQSYGK